MENTEAQAIEIFKESGALLTGHFVLRSGLHSGHFFQCAQVCQHLHHVTRLAEMLIAGGKPPPDDVDTVISPAMGGLVIGQEVARQTGKRFIFAEKDGGELVLRRGFTLQPGERVLVVEDVITRGGRVDQTLQLVSEAGGVPVGVWVLVDRGGGVATFPVPLTSLVTMSFPTYAPDQVPPELADIPISKPGS